MQLKKYALFAVATLIATGLATLAPVQQATAQTSSTPAPLLEADCETTFKPVNNSADPPSPGNATNFTVNQCKALVRFRNTIATSPETKNFANHSMAQWGTGSTPEGRRMNNWLGISVYGNPLQVTQIEAGYWARGTNGQQNRDNDAFLGGPLPELDLDDPEVPGDEDTGLFSGLSRVGLNGNRFTGPFPEWVYHLPNLGYLHLSGNDLSGPVRGERFESTKLFQVSLGSNNFSGRLPDFRFGTGINEQLTRLHLGGNSFTGQIPAGYSAFADGRPINDLILGNNPISGNIPDWVKRVKFSTGESNSNIEQPGHGVVFAPFYINRIHLGNSRLCVPDNFVMPTLTEAGSTTTASVWIIFSRNKCARGDNESVYIPGPVRDLTYTVSGNSLTVTWRAPTDSTAGTYLYDPAPVRIAAPFSIDSSVSVGDWCVVGPPYTPNSEGVYSVTYNKVALEAADDDCRFDPEKFAVNVSSVFTVGSRTDSFYPNSYTGESTSEPGWNILHVAPVGADEERKSVREIAWRVGLDLNDSLYRWDLDNQAWIRWDLDDLSLDSVFPEIGTSIITTSSRPPAWLEIAGLSSADADLSVQLGNGWNMISAGGDATRPDNDNGAFFFDEALLDCDSLAGTLAIMRYRSRNERFDVELPCHPSSEVTLTRGGSRGLIEDIEEYDSLFVYFNSTLPVCIQWSDDNSKYEAAGVGDC